MRYQKRKKRKTNRKLRMAARLEGRNKLKAIAELLDYLFDEEAKRANS
jgi:hypothetical protein